MKITNRTRNIVVSEHAQEAKSILDRSLGLLRYKTPHAFLLHTRWGIHTFGMRSAIDVIVLDESNKVVIMKKHLSPNRIFFWGPKYPTVLELPVLTIFFSQTEIGDTLTFE